MPDFRKSPSGTREGTGRASNAWFAYANAVDRAVGPLWKPAVSKHVRNWSAAAAGDLIGFWLMWHLHGGFDGLRELGMHEATIYRKVKAFRIAYGCHPDEFEMVGVSIDIAAYWKNALSIQEAPK